MDKTVLDAVLGAVLGKVLLGVITAALWFALAGASHAERGQGADEHTLGATVDIGR